MTDAGLRERLFRMPKAELHVHLDGSLRPGTMLELAAATGVRMPAAEAEALREFMYVREARDLVEYLERFEVTLSVMQSADALERIAYELAEDLAAENVRYAEIRYSPILNTRGGLALEEAVEAPLRGLRRAEREFGIRTGVIICAIRNMDPAVSLALADLAVAFRGSGVVAFDLAGAERGHPPETHRAAFARVRGANMGVTIHAGEAFGPESIHQALHLCGAHRIGHGTRLSEDPELMNYVRDFRVPLEVCLTSNVQTRAVERFEDHPLRAYFDEGLALSLNTDNRLMSATSVTEEYWRAHEHLRFTWDELTRLAVMSFEGAFLPWDEKRALIERVRRELAEI
jgi:adenosine deaminase